MDVRLNPHPCLHLDSRYEELKEKYSREVEERKRLETELKAWKAKVSVWQVAHNPFCTD